MTGEFDLIRMHFVGATASRDDVPLGIGDDCALLQVPCGQQLAVSIDTLVCGRHFVAAVDPQSLGHKALAVNLSDLAAMGATPAWVTLAISLPGAGEQWSRWLAAFVQGFSSLAAEHGVQLVGGDTTRGELSITVQVHGFVEPGQALRRDGAASGDLVYVSGTLGDAGLALLAQQGLFVGQGVLEGLNRRLDRPIPRLALGRALLPFASSAIDLSDGLGSDLGHICRASRCGALVYLDRLPVSAAVRGYIDETGDWSLPLSAGDDYELAFTVPASRQSAFEMAAATWDTPVTWVGVMQKGDAFQVMDPEGNLAEQAPGGYDHFANT